MPVMRIPYVDPLPAPRIIPASARGRAGALAALADFLTADASVSAVTGPMADPRGLGKGKAVVVTGAGISVASGLNDYRGPAGTYVVNRSYRPVYYNEFVGRHESRQRYWARSFLGWSTLHGAKPNAVHWAVKRLGELGKVSSVVTQNVDSFHTIHPDLPTIELHGFLRSNICLSCQTLHDRTEFQQQVAALNPTWAAFLDKLLLDGALGPDGALRTDDVKLRGKKGLRTNPDGDVDLPDAPWSTFRYPACPSCSSNPPPLPDGKIGKVLVDDDGAWAPGSTAGILKPAVIMFGEAIPPGVKLAADAAIDSADRVLVLGSSLATYSAWRLIKRAKERGAAIGILNLGGVRGEETFFGDIPPNNTGRQAVRASLDAQEVMPELVKIIEEIEEFRRTASASVSGVG